MYMYMYDVTVLLLIKDGCVGVFGETEKRFLFKSVIIGQLSKARFRILNSNKVVILLYKHKHII